MIIKYFEGLGFTEYSKQFDSLVECMEVEGVKFLEGNVYTVDGVLILRGGNV